MTQTSNMLTRLLSRGDKVSIVNGRLVIESKSGEMVPEEWLTTHKLAITINCLERMKVTAYQFVGYSTGQYGGGRYSGVTLQFSDVTTGQSTYACFNAITKRQRTTKQSKKGSPLPKGQFRVNKKSGFVRLWNTTGLPIPPRYYDRMGQLSSLLFTAKISQGDKLINDSIKPLNISCEELKRATKERLSSDQGTTNSRLRIATKEIAEVHAPQGIEHDSNYGDDLLRLKVIRKHGYKGNVIPLSNTVIEQTTEEWLSDYSD